VHQRRHPAAAAASEVLHLRWVAAAASEVLHLLPAASEVSEVLRLMPDGRVVQITGTGCGCVFRHQPLFQSSVRLSVRNQVASFCGILDHFSLQLLLSTISRQ
jgi:hypothetical protein